MGFDKLSTIIGFVKILVYKMMYWNRINFCGFIKIKNGFKLLIDSKSHIYIGKNVKIRYNANIKAERSGKICIKDNVFINDNANINSLDYIEIGDNVSIGHNVLILDHDHDYKNNFKEFITGPVIIKDNVWIGANVIILKNVVIGENSIIAAGSVITKNVPSNTMIIQKKEYKNINITRG